MNRDVLLSILAMDSYNRGYGEGIKGLLSIPNVTRLGNATITAESDVDVGTPGVNAGFYALAYNWNGETVISYRGINPETAVSIGRDIWNGWRLGAAIPFGGQPELAKAA